MFWSQAEKAAVKASERITGDVKGIERSIANVSWWLILTLQVVALLCSIYCAGYCQDKANSSDLWKWMLIVSMASVLYFVIAIIRNILRSL